MRSLNFHSKLRELQGQTISDNEGEQFLHELESIRDLIQNGRISIPEAGTLVRKAAWSISEDLWVNEFEVGTASDEVLSQALPNLLQEQSLA